MSKQRVIAAEGRAIAARPSLCLLLVVAVLLGAAFATPPAATAAEVPNRVNVSATSPASKPSEPQDTTTPLVFGGEEEGSTTVGIRPRQRHVFAITAAANPEDEVFIYAGPCEGEPIGEGTLGEFEDEAVGIEVVVPAEQRTMLYAEQTYPGESQHSSCSLGGFPYYEGTVPFEEESGGESPGGGSPGGGSPGGGEASSNGSTTPPQAPRIHLEPGPRANDNTPLIAGSAPGAGSVKIFAGANCAGALVAKGSANDLAAGIPINVADNTTTTFSASSSAGGAQSACSNAVTYVEDSTPPLTKITMGPGVKTRHRKVVFRFADITDDPPGTTFLCKLDHRKWKQCTSPFKLRHLGRRRHIVRVRAIDLAGNAEAKPAKRRFKVVSRP